MGGTWYVTSRLQLALSQIEGYWIMLYPFHYTPTDFSINDTSWRMKKAGLTLL